jgi:hypothetical protein
MCQLEECARALRARKRVGVIAEEGGWLYLSGAAPQCENTPEFKSFAVVPMVVCEKRLDP